MAAGAMFWFACIRAAFNRNNLGGEILARNPVSTEVGAKRLRRTDAGVCPKRPSHGVQQNVDGVSRTVYRQPMKRGRFVTFLDQGIANSLRLVGGFILVQEWA